MRILLVCMRSLSLPIKPENTLHAVEIFVEILQSFVGHAEYEMHIALIFAKNYKAQMTVFALYLLVFQQRVHRNGHHIVGIEELLCALLGVEGGNFPYVAVVCGGAVTSSEQV